MKTITLDLETTGLPPKGWDYKTDFMIAPYLLSIAWKVNNEPTKEFIINQEGRSIPPEATAINGITDEMAATSIFTIREALLMLVLEAEDSNFIIGHNIYFDTSIIKANSLRLNGNIPYPQIETILHKDKRIDTMRLCHKLLGGKWPTLSEAYSKLIGKPFIAHSAGSDVDATYEIYLELVKRGIIQHNVAMQEEE